MSALAVVAMILCNFLSADLLKTRVDDEKFSTTGFSEGSKRKFEIHHERKAFVNRAFDTPPSKDTYIYHSRSIRNMAPKVAEKAVKQPAKKAPAAKKVVKKTAGGSKKKTKAVESYKIYIYKVLKQVNAHFDIISERTVFQSCRQQLQSRCTNLQYTAFKHIILLFSLGNCR